MAIPKADENKQNPQAQQPQQPQGGTNVVDLNQQSAPVNPPKQTKPSGAGVNLAGDKTQTPPAQAPAAANSPAEPQVDPNIALKNNNTKEGQVASQQNSAATTTPNAPTAQPDNQIAQQKQPAVNPEFTQTPQTQAPQTETQPAKPQGPANATNKAVHETPAGKTLGELPELETSKPQENPNQKAQPGEKTQESGQSGIYKIIFFLLIVGILVFSGILVYLLFLS
ncbi:hypothetical protein GF389_02255 [Candidatus Dojkabacteria bacterium]|nr:hypothetical protein [Candidatus Dojkabacteria bacterium]